MILRPSARPQAILQAFAKPRVSPIIANHHGRPRRSIHTVPELPLAARDFEHMGIPEFMSKRTVQMNWNTYMSYLCDQLNKSTEGTVDYNLSALKLAEKYSHSSQHATLFNHASMAVNNHLFFSTLSPLPTQPSPRFLAAIEANYSSLSNLRQEFLETASAMFGNGFVWLMKEHGSIGGSGGNLRILCTYNAGSPYPGAHHRRQSIEMATSDMATRLTRPQNFVGAFGNSSLRREPGGTNALKAEPILCLNLWQQAWLPDYGLLHKESYIMCWWERINWQAVEQAAHDVGARFPDSYSAGGSASTKLGNLVGRSLSRSQRF